MWKCYLNNTRARMRRATEGLRTGLLVVGLLVTATAAQATVVYSLYESTDGTGAVGATVIAPSGLIQNTSDWYLSQIVPIVGNPLPGFDLAEPMSVVEYYDPFCGYRFCKAGQAWIGQDIDGFQNRLQFSLIHPNYLVPGPDLPTADGLYAIRGGHQAFHNFVAFCSIGECNDTQFQSLRIVGAGNPVPEPGSLLLMLGSLGGLAGVRRRYPARSSQG